MENLVEKAKDLAKYVRLTFEMTKLGILSAMEYRVSFLMQVIGMIVNDLGLLAVWVIFFDKFKSLNGWTLHDSLLLLSFSAFTFALIDIFCQGAFRLSSVITRGELDYYLVMPKNVLWHATFNKTSIPGLGDLFYGLGLFIISGSFSLPHLLLFLSLGLLAAGIAYNFFILLHCLTFYFGNFDDSAEQLIHTLVGFSMYPQNVFSGLLKVLTLTIIPAYFVYTIPIQLLNLFDIKLVIIMFAFWLATFYLMKSVFNAGLKNYESGNLMGTKM